MEYNPTVDSDREGFWSHQRAPVVSIYKHVVWWHFVKHQILCGFGFSICKEKSLSLFNFYMNFAPSTTKNRLCRIEIESLVVRNTMKNFFIMFSLIINLCDQYLRKLQMDRDSENMSCCRRSDRSPCLLPRRRTPPIYISEYDKTKSIYFINTLKRLSLSIFKLSFDKPVLYIR